MLDATFTTPDLTTFTGLDTLGLQVTGQFLQPDRAVLACRVLDPDDWCHRCGCHGPTRHRQPAAGARTVRLATHRLVDHAPPLPVHRVRARVATTRRFFT